MKWNTEMLLHWIFNLNDYVKQKRCIATLQFHQCIATVQFTYSFFFTSLHFTCSTLLFLFHILFHFFNNIQGIIPKEQYSCNNFYPQNCNHIWMSKSYLHSILGCRLFFLESTQDIINILIITFSQIRKHNVMLNEI